MVKWMNEEREVEEEEEEMLIDLLLLLNFALDLVKIEQQEMKLMRTISDDIPVVFSHRVNL
jgi:hypothetical protein